MVASAEFATPRRGGELAQRGEVDRIGIRNIEFVRHQLAHVLRENRADRMDRVVPIEALMLKTYQRVDDLGQLHGELALNNRVDSGVQCGLWEVNPGALVIRLYKRDLLALVEREPLSWLWCDIRIVFHIRAWMPSNA